MAIETTTLIMNKNNFLQKKQNILGKGILFFV